MREFSDVERKATIISSEDNLSTETVSQSRVIHSISHSIIQSFGHSVTHTFIHSVS